MEWQINDCIEINFTYIPCNFEGALVTQCELVCSHLNMKKVRKTVWSDKCLHSTDSGFSSRSRQSKDHNLGLSFIAT